MTKRKFKVLERAFRRFDRSTAYYCATRGDVFDPAVCEYFRQAFWELVDMED